MKINVPQNIKLMAVTKGHGFPEIQQVIDKLNIQLIGESRWQEARDKLSSFPDGIEKHFIGHLQSNKAKYIVPAFDCIESVDSLKLARAINKVAEQEDKIMPIFLQINISDDENKYGFLPDMLSEVLAEAKQLNHITVKGLMAITAKQSDEDTRNDFKKMKDLQVQSGLPELSIGMSSDWQIAVEEGATIVRVGTALFQ